MKKTEPLTGKPYEHLKDYEKQIVPMPGEIAPENIPKRIGVAAVKARLLLDRKKK